MQNESSTTEAATTTGSTPVETQKESTKPSVQSAGVEDILTTITRYPKESLKSENSPTAEHEVNEIGPSGGTLPSPNELIALGRPPLAAELLRVGPAYETFDVKEQIIEIDEFIRSEIEDDRQMYEQSLKGILNQIKFTDDVYIKVEQVRDYVRIQQKIKDVIKEKKEFEAKDPLEMSAKELERLLKEHGYRKY